MRCQVNDNIYPHLVFKHLSPTMSLLHYKELLMLWGQVCRLSSWTRFVTNFGNNEVRRMFRDVLSVERGSHVGGLLPLPHETL